MGHVGCVDLSQGHEDRDGYECFGYKTKRNCGDFDTDLFHAKDMCCFCGGGDRWDEGDGKETWNEVTTGTPSQGEVTTRMPEKSGARSTLPSEEKTRSAAPIGSPATDAKSGISGGAEASGETAKS